MTDEELRDELVTLLVAGHETTATALSWALERLARHPTAWRRLREGDEEYLDAVVKETLRLRPVLPIVVRRLTAPMTIGGFDLPAGVSVAPCIQLVHRRPDVYPEPRAFRPERFLERPAGTYTWIPFGGGVRRCLGASFAQFEMAAVLRVLARRAAALTPDRPAPECVARRSITLVPARQGQVAIDPAPVPAAEPVAAAAA
jgi:cytochrome P450